VVKSYRLHQEHIIFNASHCPSVLGNFLLMREGISERGSNRFKQS
jgi:hypothetical protein